MNEFKDLSGKVAVITGGAGALGGAFATALGRVGVKVAIVDLNAQKAQEVAREVERSTGARAVGMGADVLDATSLQQANDAIVAQLGPIDLLLNGAGGNSPIATTTAESVRAEDVIPPGSFYDLHIDSFRKVMDLNLVGTVLPSQIMSKDMVRRGRGVVVNISSMNAYRPLTRIPAYSAAKCAVSNFTQWLAVHLAPANVRVNAIAPGFFLTEQLKFLAYDEKGELTPRYRKVIAHTPMGRLGEPEELTGTLLYLFSDHSRFVTGVVIPVDGGFNAYAGV